MEATNGPAHGAGPGPIMRGDEASDETLVSAGNGPRASADPVSAYRQGQTEPSADADAAATGEPEETGPVLDAGPYTPDEEALRGTRFEFGGRRPFSFTPPRVAQRGPQRPLPGIGTVALGRVARVAQYGAFVDFLGFRGLVHISQLMPGYRIERVEDVVEVGDEVVVRVIAIDPERRHINLALVPHSAAAEAAPAPAAQPASPIAPASSPPDLPAAQHTDAERPGPSVPAAAPSVSPAVMPAAAMPTPFAVTPAAQPSPPPPAATPLPRPAAAGPAAPAVQSPLRPSSSAAGPAPANRPATSAATASRDRPQPRPTPKPQVSKHASRAVGRDVASTHPMARLLATAGEDALHPERHKARYLAENTGPPAGGPPATPQEAPRPTGVSELRPVHVSEPEPEPEEDQPATLEALAARFGQRAAAANKEAKPPATRTSSDRSRQEREKQAAILARLRQNSGN